MQKWSDLACWKQLIKTILSRIRQRLGAATRSNQKAVSGGVYRLGLALTKWVFYRNGARCAKAAKHSAISAVVPISLFYGCY